MGTVRILAALVAVVVAATGRTAAAEAGSPTERLAATIEKANRLLDGGSTKDIDAAGRLLEPLVVDPPPAGLTNDLRGCAEATLGFVRLQQERPQQAQSLLERALERALDPDSCEITVPRVHIALAWLHDEARYPDAASEQAREAIDVLLGSALRSGAERRSAARDMADVAWFLRLREDHEQVEGLVRRIEERTAEGSRPDSDVFEVALLSLRAYLLGVRGRHTEAEAAHREALSRIGRRVPPDDPLLRGERDALALNLWLQGRAADAEPLLRKVLVAKRPADVSLDQWYITTAATGGIHEDAGRLDLAERSYARAAAFHAAVLGAAHHSVAGLVFRRAAVLAEQGRYADAEKAYRAALEVVRQNDGPLSDEYANTLAEMSWALHHQDRRAEAEKLVRQSISIFEAQESPNYRRLAKSLNYLGSMLRFEDRFEEAELVFKRALDLGVAHLEPGDSITSSSRLRLGSLYMESGQLEKAEPLIRAVVEERRSRNGERDPWTVTAMGEFGRLLLERGKYAEAESIYRRLVALGGSVETDQNVQLSNKNGLSRALSGMGRHEEALALALEVVDTALGRGAPETIDLALYFTNVGVDLWKLGRCAEAATWHRRALAIRERLEGPECIGVAITLNNLGSALWESDLPGAEASFRRALAIFRQRLGDTHPSTANTLSNLGGLLSDNGRVDEAEIVLRDALRVREAALGPDHPDVAVTQYNLACTLFLQRRWDDALPLIRASFETRLAAFGKGDERVTTSLRMYVDTLRKLGLDEQADRLVGQHSEP